MSEETIQTKPIREETDEARNGIKNLSILIPTQYGEVKKAELLMNTASTEEGRGHYTEELKIELAEFYGLLISSFSACETYIQIEEDKTDFTKYYEILLRGNLKEISEHIDDLRKVGMRLLKNSGLSTLAEISRVESIKTQIDMEKIN